MATLLSTAPGALSADVRLRDRRTRPVATLCSSIVTSPAAGPGTRSKTKLIGSADPSRVASASRPMK
ncbi:hypothetical protein, partial [Mesorhizobium sp. M8A.F.Ca.ET.167.01.1.1]|uniref:hypothetical protein n=1 Tax=Mesorhizobium sp. M8A.F.Ca.ET.167.01.1.1 TaxID=2563961 RepID=UPI001AEDDED9